MDVVRGVLALAAARRYVPTSAAAGVELEPKGDGVEINPLTHAEVRALLAALPEQWRLPVLLDVYTGLRAGELWALRRRDVDALRGELLVDEAIKEVTAAGAAKVPDAQRITPSLIVGPTKTYAKRKVSVPAFLRDELAAHLGRSLPRRRRPGSVHLYDADRRAGPPQPVLQACVLARRPAGVPGSRAPLPRPPPHAHAAWLIEANAHPLQIKLRLGHKEIRTTMDTYGHLFPSAEPEMAGLLDAAYRGVAARPAVVSLES